MTAQPIPYRTRPGVHPSIQINVLRKLPNERYIAALERIKQIIVGGEPFKFYDEPDCTWGLCSESKQAWPDAADHIFPVDFEQRGRMSMLDHGLCPLDTRTKQSMNGCYYSCRAKNHQKKPITREQVIEWYDQTITRANATKR